MLRNSACLVPGVHSALAANDTRRRCTLRNSYFLILAREIRELLRSGLTRARPMVTTSGQWYVVLVTALTLSTKVIRY